MAYFVYILKSQKDNDFYVGFTGDLGARIKRHNAGNVRSTKGRRPFILVYQEQIIDRKEARQREKYLKSGCGREYLKSIIKK